MFQFSKESDIDQDMNSLPVAACARSFAVFLIMCVGRGHAGGDFMRVFARWPAIIAKFYQNDDGSGC